MENIGALALLLAFCLAIYSVAGSLIGKFRNNLFLIVSAERAVYATTALVTAASVVLIYSIMQGDYRMVYVHSVSNQTMPWYYKIAAWWGGQEGSLLFWAWLLGCYSSVVMFTNRRKFREGMPYVTSILMTTMAFFLMLITFVLSPFDLWAAGKAVFTPQDGRGLNPLLQYWTMVIHPPTLYLGYVGFVVPFAFAIAALINKQPGDQWIHTTRRWTLVTWAFQTTGILLGAGWAYAVLGWGGYWAWDPVENASLLPWITSTAFLHSVMMQEKRGMMKVWNMVLVSATFFLCIFGTFLTRSGLVSSVHAFAQSPIGNYFAWYLGLGVAATAALIIARLEFLKPETQLESVLSRESSFLFNNLILLASCFAVLWGTLFPVISEAVTGEKISVDKPFFDRVNIPIGLGLLLLTGIGPLIAWRRSSVESLKKAFLWPSIGALGTVAVLAALGVRHLYALISFGLCVFVAWTVVAEFIKGASALRAKNEFGWFGAMVELTHRNTRRYGGYIVHMGVVVMFIGFTGAAFNQDTTVEVNTGSVIAIGPYQLKIGEMTSGKNDNYQWGKLPVEVSSGGKVIGMLHPERRFYMASEQPTSEVSIRRRLNEDLYLNFAGTSSTDQSKLVLQAYVFPLVSWIWVGYWVTLFGTLICLVPAKSQQQFLRTQVVGVTPAHATPVEK
ncbi:cytochrome c biogenesis protein CcmF [Bryobacterales bacterium F-183]|nr:cytochrome c biogenesis protein CcmF [Bryobacterales bacterium F-183]